MSEETPSASQPVVPPDQQNVQLVIDERDLKTNYANAYRVFTWAEEVIVDIGFNMPNPNTNAQGGQQSILFRITDRVIMSYANAKRLSSSLTQVIKRYEQQFGEVPIQPGPRR